MSAQAATRHGDAPSSDAGNPAQVPETHVVLRTGAPPIRFVGNLMFHHVDRSRASKLFVSLWAMRRGGYILAHSLPDHGVDCKTAFRAEDLETAIDALADYCADISPPQIVADEDNILNATLEATITTSRIEAFRSLVGLALADWEDRRGTFTTTH